jgi:GxxExxY protein
MQQGGGEAGSIWGLSEQVIGACIEVHRALGPGLLETAYEQCLAHELLLRAVPFERQRPVRVAYKGIQLEYGYRLDFVVAEVLILEVKAVEKLAPVHEAQLLTYLKLTGLHTGLLINFNAEILRRGLRRLTSK